MLHFVYNTSVVGCLVNHSYSKGVFVLQVPVSLDLQDSKRLLDLSDKSLVVSCLGPSLGIQAQDIE